MSRGGCQGQSSSWSRGTEYKVSTRRALWAYAPHPRSHARRACPYRVGGKGLRCVQSEEREPSMPSKIGICNGCERTISIHSRGMYRVRHSLAGGLQGERAARSFIKAPAFYPRQPARFASFPPPHRLAPEGFSQKNRLICQQDRS